MTSQQLQALFNKYGKSATLRIYEETNNRNDQGEVVFSESTQDLTVIIGWAGSAPRVIERSLGESVFVEEQIFALTKDIDLSVATDAVDKKPRIEHGGEVWKVERTIESPSPPGLTMFQTQRMRA